MNWSSSEAKPKFCELVRSAEADGPQTITRRGAEVAVVISIEEYRRLTTEQPNVEECVITASE
jgi:prevent-host-death family protein